MRLMKSVSLAVGLFVVTSGAATAADHSVCPPDTKYRVVKGLFKEIVVDPFAPVLLDPTQDEKFVAPGDPFGRVVNYTLGTLNSIGTAILTGVGPGPSPGTLQATTHHVFVTSDEDLLKAEGVAVFTPIPGSTNVGDVLTLTLVGGTGAFEGATGQIVATGTGFNFFDGVTPFPRTTAGRTFFEFRLNGYMCLGE